MTSLLLQEKKCGCCHQSYIHHSLRSFNSIGALHYTDGSISTLPPMGIRLSMCPLCSAYAWAEDLETVRIIPESEYGSMISRAADPDYNDSADLRSFVGFSPSKLFMVIALEPWKNEEQERYLRLDAWRAVARLYLPNPTKYEFVAKYDQGRLEKLADDEWILKAELLQRIGRQEECISTLEHEGAQKLLRSNMLRLLELCEGHIVISAELLRQLGRFDEAKAKLCDQHDAEIISHTKRIYELAEAGKKFLCVVD